MDWDTILKNEISRELTRSSEWITLTTDSSKEIFCLRVSTLPTDPRYRSSVADSNSWDFAAMRMSAILTSSPVVSLTIRCTASSSMFLMFVSALVVRASVINTVSLKISVVDCFVEPD